MPRTLPWLDAPSTTRSTRIKPKKSQNALLSDSDDDTPPFRTKPQLKNAAPPRAGMYSAIDEFITNTEAGRTPSTSPPPIPPTEEYYRPLHSKFFQKLTPLRFMLEGLDRDDIYIMVEDEFHAIAKTFTKHLHHAEYMRLKVLAKTRNPSAASMISRPVDSITAMRTETKRRKQAEARDARNEATLEQLKKATVQAQREQSDNDSSDLDIEDRDGGRWRGTALQGLMTASSRKNQASLTGLQSVKSSTRAAAGFSKAEKRPVPHSAKTFDLGPKPRPERQIAQQLSEASTSEGAETEDLDAPAPPNRPTRASKPPPKANRKPVEESLRRPMKPPLPSVSTKSLEQSKSNVSRPRFTPSKSKTGSTHTSSKDDAIERRSDSDSSPPPATSRVRESEAARRRLKARASARKERQKRKSGNADEIPVFMV